MKGEGSRPALLGRILLAAWIVVMTIFCCGRLAFSFLRSL